MGVGPIVAQGGEAIEDTGVLTPRQKGLSQTIGRARGARITRIRTMTRAASTRSC
jgi:hypothetical protein